ncbi:MAG: glycosyltransferase family 2 protein [Spirochaetes bacterium]|nr:glycosyltransferase family 2 protein [Spirochaetota bacterium]
MQKISTVIITFNEQDNIKECVKSVLWTDEIIIIDSFSTDKTIKICRSFGRRVKLYKRKWKGYADQKNFGIKKATNPWILSLDADERITRELKKEISICLSQDKTLKRGYQIPRKNYYFGRWIRRGGNYPDLQLRLFQKRYGKFSLVPLHEGVSLTQTGVLKHPMIHYSYKNINDYFKRFIIYTDMEKEIFISKKVKVNIFSSFYYIVLLPFKKFISRFIFKLGFLDGLDGFIVLQLNNITRMISYYKYYLWYKRNV